MNPEGYLDDFTNRRIAGWVRDRDAPGRRVQLEARLGNTRLADLVADGFREDLRAAGIGDGRHAFALDLPRPLSDVECALLNLRIPGSSRLFLAGELHLLRQDLPPPPAPTRRFRRCILHIGTEKTGTTALQSFLDTNRAGLAGAGIFQPRSLTWPSDAPHAGARALVAFARRDENPDDPVKRAEGATDEAGLLAWRTRLAAAFATELAAAPGNCDTILLSSEQCHSNLWRIDEVQAVHQLLAPFCDGFEVIVYLRAQHELAVSAYGMLLRDGHHDAVMLPDFSVPPLTTALRRHYFDHETLLARWSSVFGTKAMRVQFFARDTLLNGDIVDDFASLALPPGNWRRVARSNTNQSAAAQHLLIGLGRALAARSAGEAEHVRAWLVPRLAASAPGNGIRPTRDGVAGFMAQFAQANNRVRAAWFPARDQLFPIDLGEFPETELPAEDRLAAACTALIETILRELPR